MHWLPTKSLEQEDVSLDPRDDCDVPSSHNLGYVIFTFLADVCQLLSTHDSDNSSERMQFIFFMQAMTKLSLLMHPWKSGTFRNEFLEQPTCTGYQKSA